MNFLRELKFTFKEVKLLRSSIFFLIAFTSIITSFIYFAYQIEFVFYVNLVYLLLILLCAFIYLRCRLFFPGRYVSFLATCTLTLVLSNAEGIEGLAFLYFLPIATIIPLINSKNEQFKFQALLFYGTFFTFLVATTFVTTLQNTQHYTPDQVKILRRINLSIIFLTTIFYSIFGLLQERSYINRLKKNALAAEELKDKRMAMLSVLGHEIRTQATSINAASGMLSETKITSEQQPLVDVLNYCTSQMFYLINDILDLRKIETGKLSLQLAGKDLRHIINTVTIPFRERAQTKKLDLKTNFDERLGGKVIMVDEFRLNQVLHNLLSNALKYTQEGTIFFTVKLLDENEDHLSIYFEVADTGIGIAAENLDKIFDSFYQAKSDDIPIYGGSGLGLTIASNIIEEMRSTLNVESVANKGSRFYFTLQTEIGKLTEKAVENPVIKKQLQGVEVLVVDDNKMGLMFATKLLQQKGVTVHQAKNGLEAIETFKLNPATSVILLDLEMPEMNGYVAISELKNINPGVTVIAFTANIPDAAFIEKLINLGFADVLSKPYEPKTFIDKVQQHV
ncbi:MAG: hypothetical protein BGN92_12805 [Sphingobacteriales bacterium 41-5]|nr:MAG: hypothetical protein ABS67_00520 [Niabella sp. SCN 42-15]OJU29368.1 MAG: hypothetical protein BGN92_12805 [Sphingobacteriales bacterium 41-5]